MLQLDVMQHLLQLRAVCLLQYFTCDTLHTCCSAPRWGDLPIEFEVPPSLAARLMVWIMVGHGMMAQTQPMLFMHSGARREALSNVQLSQWFSTLLARYSFRPIFTPNELRHVFVDSICSSEDGVQRQELRGFARIMGNSVERWGISYDRNLSKRTVEEAASEMEEWRHQLLALLD